MIATEEEIRAAIAVQAGEWFIANQAGPLSEVDRAAFLTWLRTSPVHVREYLGIARVARSLPAAVGDSDVPLERFLAELPTDETTVTSLRVPASRRARPASRFSIPLSMVASLLALAAGVLWWAHDGERFGLPKSYVTAHGEQRLEQLPDGSLLHLDTDSAVTVRYSGTERLVVLDRGQALFEVAHDRSRRFRVAAGEAGAIAVGTQFNVYRTTGATVVTVAEGTVAVFRGEPVWLSGTGDAPVDVQRVTAGYQLRVDAGAIAAQPAAVDLHQVLGWLQHKIVFEHQPLGDVAAAFNRYGRIPIEIEDEKLRSLPVSGTFDADDTESFVAFLQTLPEVRVERTPTRIRVVRIKTTL